MPAYLDSILMAHRAVAARDRRDPSATVDAARAHLEVALGTGGRGAPRDFTAALVAGSEARGMAVISEIKRRSPSRGDLDPGLDPAVVAAEYESGGACCLSVLTDREFFGGSPADLEAARAACNLPVLRKDFTVSPLDVCDARTMGADAVLLIVAALDDGELTSLLDLARGLRLAPLVEVHDEEELDRPWPRAPISWVSTSGICAPSRWTGPGRCGWGSGYPPRWWPWLSPGSGTPPTSGSWPPPATPPSSWGRHWCGRPTAPPPSTACSGRGHDRPSDDGPELFVKICGITSEADALLAVGLGASAVGFIFAPSPRQMAASAVADIVKRVPHETVTVGVFRDESPRRVVEIASRIGLRAVQLHGHESAEETRWVAERVPWTIKVFPAGHRTSSASPSTAPAR